MRLIVWGTGNLYQKYKTFLSQFELVRLCDNNPDKKGKFLDGVEIILPSQLIKWDFDYVVVMTYATEQVCQQAEGLGISADKLILYSQLWCLKESDMCIHSGNTKMCFDDWIVNNPNSILLISHNFSYTGISVALKNMANVLRKMGYSILIAAMDSGPFVRELRLENIDYIDNLEIGYQTEHFENMLRQFVAVVIGSFDLYRMASVIERVKTPAIWWVHETHERYYIGKERLPQRDGLKFFAGGNRVKKIFNSHYRETEIQKLQYCIPDSHKDISRGKENAQMVVAVIGSVDERKAQDILLEAIINMPEEYRNRLKVIFVGRMDENDGVFAGRIKRQTEQLNNLQWISELSQEKLEELYSNIDILVCPSRDDPMPIVVTQAMMHEKICVISECVGQAEFIKQRKNGFVFPNEDAETLTEILIWILDHRDKCTVIGQISREVYKEEFSEEVMERELSKILKGLYIAEDK